ncbi:MAG: hypothetical protein HC912_04610 [Saprospiraceae bacterium]|nr:hypothetical protein [Saprospiraceae bacterium]
MTKRKILLWIIKFIEDDEFDFDNFASDSSDDDGDSYDDQSVDDDDETNLKDDFIKWLQTIDCQPLDATYLAV